jgi:hypothetical protein
VWNPLRLADSERGPRVQKLSNYAPAAEIGSLLSNIEHNLPISATSGTIVRFLIAGATFTVEEADAIGERRETWAAT